MSNLSDSIKDLYQDITEAEAVKAADDLVIFFKILNGIEKRLAHQESNELKNDNIGSAN
ncbi:MAG: hypothetical protein J0H68_00280 [Sphingobacteriia bacterium]|nr:hypothetical protein [Sphingobacteriia bacterium]